MLRFFREKAAVIGWVIVIFFAGTMFTGSLFMGLGNSKVEQPSVKSEQSFANLGMHSININKYYQYIQSRFQNISSLSDISPLVLEQVKLEAFNYAVESEAFYLAAIQDGVSLTKQDIKRMEKEFLLENDFKNKSDLKKKLKENNMSYKQFQKDINRDFLIRKFRLELMSSVSLDQDLVDNSLKAFKYDVIELTFPLENISVTENMENVSGNIHVIADSVFTLLNDGETIASIKDQYVKEVNISISEGVDFVDFLSLNSEYREIIGSLSEGDYLEPICETISNIQFCFISQIKSIEVKDIPEDYTEETYSEALLQQLQQKVVQERVQQVFVDNDIRVNVPDIGAVYYKSLGQLEKSLEAYQEIQSQNPSSSVPHFFKAELYYRMDNLELTLEELKKASIKAKLDEQNDFPEIYIFYGDVLMDKNNRDEALAQYEKAVKLVPENLEYLRLMRLRFEEHDFEDQLISLDDSIALLEEQLEEERIRDLADEDAVLEDVAQ